MKKILILVFVFAFFFTSNCLFLEKMQGKIWDFFFKKKNEYYEAIASWYGPGFWGKCRADGKIYHLDDNKIFVAHKDYPLGTRLKITNLNNGKTIVAKVLDRGPYIYGREIDLSYGAAKILGAIEPGLIPVRIEKIEHFSSNRRYR
ncbi:MAG: septal ring lytic transglycosylase RlpA family protein [Patescibacteria group bacterium]